MHIYPFPYAHGHSRLFLNSLLLGVTHRAAGEFGPARAFLTSAAETRAIQDDKWVSAVAYYELGVLDLREVAVLEKQQGSSPSSRGTLKRKWEAAIASALARMDQATANLGDTDLSSRLESRIAMVSFRSPTLFSELRKKQGTRSDPSLKHVVNFFLNWALPAPRRTRSEEDDDTVMRRGKRRRA